jgi:hypothetical protein
MTVLVISLPIALQRNRRKPIPHPCVRTIMTDDTSRPRGEGGEFVEEITPGDALAVFTGREPLTAKEVAGELGVVRRTAYNKLSDLEERGDLRKKKVGARAVIWWRPE